MTRCWGADLGVSVRSEMVCPIDLMSRVEVRVDLLTNRPIQIIDLKFM